MKLFKEMPCAFRLITFAVVAVFGIILWGRFQKEPTPVLATETPQFPGTPTSSATLRPTATVRPSATPSPSQTIAPTKTKVTPSPTNPFDPTVPPETPTATNTPYDVTQTAPTLWWQGNDEYTPCSEGVPPSCIYRVRANDSYTVISRKFYNDSRYWYLIRNYNRNFDGTYQRLYVNALLFIPVIPNNLGFDVYQWGECIDQNGMRRSPPCFYPALDGDRYTDIARLALGSDGHTDFIKAANIEGSGKPKGDQNNDGVIEENRVYLVIPMPPDY